MAKYLVSDGHEAPELGPKDAAIKDWAAAWNKSETSWHDSLVRIAELEAERVGMREQINKQAAEIAERGQRLANRDRTIDTLMTRIIGMDATIAGLITEAKRLSDLAQDLQAQLSARHGAAGEPQTGVSNPCETPRANPFAHGWATNWKMRGV